MQARIAGLGGKGRSEVRQDSWGKARRFPGAHGRPGPLPPDVCLSAEDSSKRGSSTKNRCCSESSGTFQGTPGAVLQETEFPTHGSTGQRNGGAADRGGWHLGDRKGSRGSAMTGDAGIPHLRRQGHTEESWRKEGLPPKSAVTEGGGHSRGHSITAGRSKGEKDPSFSSHLPFSFWYLPSAKPRLQPEAPAAPRGPPPGAQRRAERVLQGAGWVGSKQRAPSYSGSPATSQQLHTPACPSPLRGVRGGCPCPTQASEAGLAAPSLPQAQRTPAGSHLPAPGPGLRICKPYRLQEPSLCRPDLRCSLPCLF